MSQEDKTIDALASTAFGKTRSEAHSTGKCLRCGQPAIANCRTAAGVREYKISGLCERCFDELIELYFPEEDYDEPRV